MRSLQLLVLSAAALLTSTSAQAQTPGRILISVSGSWIINTDSGTVADQDTFFVSDSGGSLAVTSRCDSGTGVNAYNICDTDLQGVSNGSSTYSGSASSSIFAFTSFLWTGQGNGTVSVSAIALATGILPAGQLAEMSAISQMTLTVGVFGTQTAFQTTATSQIVPSNTGPGTTGTQTGGTQGTGGQPVGARLIRSQGAPIVGSMQLTGFYHTVVGSSSGSATLEPGDSVFGKVRTIASADIFLF